jgi:hypothetical protein
MKPNGDADIGIGGKCVGIRSYCKLSAGLFAQ